MRPDRWLEAFGEPIPTRVTETFSQMAPSKYGKPVI